jgi:hypothetical protein
MPVVLICRDRPGGLPTRLATREAHLAYLRESGVVRMAGPLLDDAGGMIGSLLVLDLPDRAAAMAWADADPYARAGLFESVTAEQWTMVIG